MLIRLEPTFINTMQQLKKPFSDEDKEELSELVELNYDKITSIVLSQEKSKEGSKPAIIQLGKIGTYSYALNLYYNEDEDDIPNSIRELMPSVSPVRVDVMAIPEAPGDPDVKYMKAAQLFDDGSVRSTYVKNASKWG